MSTLLASRRSAGVRPDWRVLVDRRMVPLVVLGYLLCRAFSAVVMIWLSRHQPAAGVPGGVTGGNAVPPT